MFCIHLCRSNLFSALAAGILWKLNPGLFLREFVQPNAAQVATMMTLWKMTTVFRSSSWNFLSLHYVTYFICQILQISTENVTYVKFLSSGYFFSSHISSLNEWQEIRYYCIEIDSFLPSIIANIMFSLVRKEN